MPQFRRLGAMTAIVAALLLVFTSVAAARPGPQRFGPWTFDDVWVGTPVADTYFSLGDSRDKIVGLAGNDMLGGGDGRDVVKGNAGNDHLYGGDDSDRVYGGGGNDVIAGGEGPDFLSGGFGADFVKGGPGQDLIKAGPGPDYINAVDGERDWVYCGRGWDFAKVDMVDRVAATCERVVRVAVDATE